MAASQSERLGGAGSANPLPSAAYQYLAHASALIAPLEQDGHVDTLADIIARVAARVDLGLRRHDAVLVETLDSHGARFAPGTQAVALPSGTRLIVGIDGRIEIDAFANDRRLALAGDQPCTIDLPLFYAPHGATPLACQHAVVAVEHAR